MTLTHQGHQGAQVLVEQISAGPDPASRRASESALVIGIGGDPLRRPMGRGEVESIGIVVHAVHADHDGPRLGGCVPALQGQPRPVEAYEVRRLKPRALKAELGPPGLLPQGSARGHEEHEHDEQT